MSKIPRRAERPRSDWRAVPAPLLSRAAAIIGRFFEVKPEDLR